MLADAQRIINELGKDVFIKVPTTTAGLSAMKELKTERYLLTATAIYSEFQGYLALNVGADYLAPYVNRMENLNIQTGEVIKNLSQRIHQDRFASKIVAASFKNVQQINTALQNGAQAITIPPTLIEQGLAMSEIDKAVTDFQTDWQKQFGVKNVFDL